MFSSYTEHPTKCRFEGQDPDEKILLLLRAHPITNLSWIFLAVLVFFIPFVAPMIINYTGFNLAVLPGSFIMAFVIINYLLVLIIVFEGFLEWYFNATLVTTEKIIDIHFTQIVFKSMDLAPLNKIEETDSMTGGIIGTFFNFGNVKVQTAGATVAIEMHKIPRPALVADMILDLVHKPHEHI